ncbi:PREDICTED: thyroid adenoma-associated protein homolog [Nicrophorus vespilloides]|uniref:tRNA (32-2'-O)-methyltransferase regulator THADA n=1 Tax=Nicrophorus vespilloides TaxID=110193 RepID=A0ABM1NIK2_NICVS|nr:PREDICTED: thyroid adenoma-associated protein homolog [Nicrophorus vespilloides]XP_017786653.1 PREDICTED: thyroid adenoma-associated protein homolog [Nicrophorus vespilloides]
MSDRTGSNMAPAQIPQHFQLKSKKLCDIMKNLVCSTSVVDQQRYLKNLTTNIPAEDYDSVLNIVCYIFLYLDSKHPIKKTAVRILLTMESKHVVNALTVQLICYISPGSMNLSILEKLNEENAIIVNLTTCFNNFPPGVEALSCTIDFIYKFAYNTFIKAAGYLDKEPEENTVPMIIYNTSRFLVCLFNQCDLSSKVPETALKLLYFCSNIINNDRVNFNTKLNCGILLSLAALHSSENNERNMIETISHLLQMNERAQNTSGTIRSYTTRVCVFSGILNTFPHEIICADTLSDVPAPVYIFRTFLESATKSTGHPAEILEISRTFISLSKLLSSMHISAILMVYNSTLEYIWTHLDHYLDTVRHDTSLVLKNVAKAAVRHESQGNSELIDRMISHLTTMFDKSNANYKALTIISTETTSNYILSKFPNLPGILLNSMKNVTLTQQVSNSYEIMMEQNFKEQSSKELWTRLWVRNLVPLFQTTDDTLHFYLKKVFTKAFQLDNSVLKLLSYDRIKYDNPRELSVLLSCFVLARKLNITLHPENDYDEEFDDDMYWNGMIEFDLLELLMVDQNPDIRIATLTLVVESQKSTQFFTEWDLKFLIRFLHYNVTTQLPNLRQQMLALYKKAFTRYKDGMYVIERNIRSLMSSEGRARGFSEIADLNTHRENYKEFVVDIFVEELTKGLYNDVNYSRRCICLELLINLKDILQPDIIEMLWNRKHVELLYQSLVDSFESNIMMATRLLLELPQSVVHYHTKVELKDMLRNSIVLAASLKPTSTVTAAYQIQVLMESPHAHEVIGDILRPFDERLVNMEGINTLTLLVNYLFKEIQMGLGVAADNITIASKYAPIHGLIFALRHIITKHSYDQKNPEIVPRLIDLCLTISDIVLPIVNNSSPEGYMPNDDELVADETVTSQMILIYAWRSTKEVSLLLGELCIDSLIEIPEYLSQVSDYFINLFMETKHRGAYEQAFVGFNKFCRKLWNAGEMFMQWPVQWMKINLDVVKGSTDYANICPTRRSAGLPFMFQAILTTEPPERSNETFHHSMNTLIEIANDFNNDMGATHSMNILRALFKHNQLGELVTPYVGRGVQIAINRFRHLSWNVRNSATLLFSALMTRIFGVQRTKDSEELSIKNRLSARVFFLRYPELYGFILGKLKEYMTERFDNASLYPLLFILSRLYSSGEKKDMQQYLLFVEECLKNKMMKMRELAAQASIAVIPLEEYFEYVKKSLIEIRERIPNNALHGKLLQLNVLVKNLPINIPTEFDVPALITGSFWIIEESGITIPHLTATLYMELILQFLTKFKSKCFGRREFNDLMLVLIKIPEVDKEKYNVSIHKTFVLTKITLFIHIFAYILDIATSEREKFIKNILLSALHDPHEDLQIYAINCIHFLFANSLFKKFNYFPINDEEDREVYRESTLIQPMNEVMKMRIASMITTDLGCYNLFTDIFYIMINRSDKYSYKVCQILPYFPCIINKLRPKTVPVSVSRQTIMDFMICECIRKGGDMVCVILPIISTLAFESKQKMSYTTLINDILKPFSKMETSVDQRLAVCNFLVQNSKFLHDIEVLCVNNIVQVWYIVISLLQDQEEIVRERMSKITNYIQWPISPFIRRFILGVYVIPEKSLEELMLYMPGMIPFEEAMHIYLHLILPKPKTYMEAELFDKGELNTYEENEVIAMRATKFLKKYMWALEDDLSYDDKSIFIEEHILLVSTKLFNLFYLQQSNSEVQVISMLLLKAIINFVEVRLVYEQDFETEFQKYLREQSAKSFPNENHKGVITFFKAFYAFES